MIFNSIDFGIFFPLVFFYIGYLGFFKYFNFFIDSFIEAFSVFGTDIDGYHLNIILPVGISFYTFQTLSYTLDIYYKKLKSTNNVFAFLAFVSFFPQLVAGPIVRAKNLLPQFLKINTISYDLLRSGLLLMVWGFFKKIVIADRLAIFVDNAYLNIDSLDGITSIVTTIFFTFQLYLDFSAYSDIAIGSARILGFNLSTNFRRPFLSSSFSDFWKRWHISLSSWFKDYVCIPLAGNRVTKTKFIRNILIVFILSGLGPISTGTFTEFNSVDSGNPFSGTQSNAGPPVPGEDFFLNAPTGETFPLNIRGRKVVITIEPNPDNSPLTPFLLKPLILDVSPSADVATATHSFAQNLGSFPTGTATR
ncbi:MAG: MBOAT family O-acyltransferase [Flavobacteriales bacterium]